MGDINQPITWVIIGLFRHLRSVFMREQLRQCSSRGRAKAVAVVEGVALADPEGEPWKQGQLFSHHMDCPVCTVSCTYPGPASFLSWFMYVSPVHFTTAYDYIIYPFLLVRQLKFREVQ